MKAILYVGAVLMTGASIYGFIDYRKTSRDKAFTGLYNSSETATVPETKKITIETNANPEPSKLPTEIKKTSKVVASKKSAVVETKNKTVAAKMTTNPVLPVKTETISNVTITPKPVTIKRKKISARLFSRAALDERYIDKDVKLEKSKKDKQ